MISRITRLALLTATGAAFALASPTAMAGPKKCPPGLAKKNNGCLPPGIAKKRYQVGEVLPSDVQFGPVNITTLPDTRPGEIYVEVDGDVLRMVEATRKVLEAVIAVDAATRATSD